LTGDRGASTATRGFSHQRLASLSLCRLLGAKTGGRRLPDHCPDAATERIAWQSQIFERKYARFSRDRPSASTYGRQLDATVRKFMYMRLPTYIHTQHLDTGRQRQAPLHARCTMTVFMAQRPKSLSVWLADSCATAPSPTAAGRTGDTLSGLLLPGLRGLHPLLFARR
jgi:hypothetical protein